MKRLFIENDVEGIQCPPLIEIINPVSKECCICYNITSKDAIHEITGDKIKKYIYTRVGFDTLPTIEEISEYLKTEINKETDIKIVSGMRWPDIDGQMVWLSMENQSTYGATVTMAERFPDKVLPVTFKFGPDVAPSYYTFKTLDELKLFSLAIFAHINNCYNEGWVKKDSLDLEKYASELERIKKELENAQV